MQFMSAIPLMISGLTGLLLGLVAWGSLRLRRPRKDAPMETDDDVLLGLLVLAAFSLGAFLTYLLLGFDP